VQSDSLREHPAVTFEVLAVLALAGRPVVLGCREDRRAGRTSVLEVGVDVVDEDHDPVDHEGR
jgi:hypothetical protein